MSAAFRMRGLIALAILVMFLGAELHFLADLDSAGSHVCPVCAALGSAALSPPPSLALLPVVAPARQAHRPKSASREAARFVSLRAPPRV